MGLMRLIGLIKKEEGIVTGYCSCFHGAEEPDRRS